MRISFAWPNADPASAASESAAANFASCMISLFISDALILFGPRLRLRPSAHRDVGVDTLALALELDLGRLTGRERGDQVQHAGGIGDRLALHLEQHIAWLDARLVGGPAAQHPGDQRAARVVELE